MAKERKEWVTILVVFGIINPVCITTLIWLFLITSKRSRLNRRQQGYEANELGLEWDMLHAAAFF